MRIVLSNASAKWGGVHLITDLLATGLQERGHELMIVCRPGSVLHERMADRFPCAPFAHGMDFSPLAIGRIAGALRAFRPGAVMTMMDKDLRQAGVAARALGIPVVASRANDQPFGDSVRHRIAQRSIPSLHIANSHSTRRTMLESAPWLDPDLVRVIYNGVDVDGIAGAAPAVIPATGNGPIVGFVGRLESRKGTLDLLAAWPVVSAACTDAHLVIAGKGPMQPEVEAAAGALHNVHYVGYRTDVAAILHATDVVAVPSRWEGFGLVAAEAMAAGKPVVVANASSLPEIVRDGVDGILVPPRDPQALAAALTALLRDPDLRQRMGASGLARVRSEFSHQRMVDEYEVMLREIAAGGTART